MLVFNSTNYKSKAIGSSLATKFKGHRVVTISTNFVKNETWVRTVTDYDITINEMDADNYKILLDIFSNSGENDFSFIDTEDTAEGQHYFIDADGFNLTKIEDKHTKTHYYTGQFKISKY